MNTFEIKSTNRKKFLSITIPLILVAGLSLIPLFPWAVRNGKETFLVIGLLVAIGLIFFGLKKILSQKYTVIISEKDINLSQNGHILKNAALDSITMIQHHFTELGHGLIIYTSAHESLFAKFDFISKNSNIEALIQTITSLGDYSSTTQHVREGLTTIEYINKKVIAHDVEAIQNLRSTIKIKKKNANKIVIAVLLAVLLLTISPFFINPKAFYENKDGKIYYGSTEMVGVKPEESSTLSYTVLKDSSHIYYKGKVLDWPDRVTFRFLERVFYMDKNGIYYETTNLFTPNQIVPIEGDYDKGSFKSVGRYSSEFYKDKNHLYTIDFEFLNTKEPLKKVEIEGLDVQSFENLGHTYWYADKNRLYFYSISKLRACPDIDRASFEILTGEVFKDKNHVYYLTSELSAGNKRATKKSEYAILEGADAPTFKKIDDRNFEDKNETWTIREKNEHISMRKAVK